MLTLTKRSVCKRTTHTIRRPCISRSLVRFSSRDSSNPNQTPPIKLNPDRHVQSLSVPDVPKVSNIVYYIPFYPRPQIIIDKEFLSKLNRTASLDDYLLMSHQSDIHKHFIPKYSQSIVGYSPHIISGQFVRTLAHIAMWCYIPHDIFWYCPPVTIVFMPVIILIYLCYIVDLTDSCDAHEKYLFWVKETEKTKKN